MILSKKSNEVEFLSAFKYIKNLEKLLLSKLIVKKIQLVLILKKI